MNPLLQTPLCRITVLAASVALLLSGCAPDVGPQDERTSSVSIQKDLRYGNADGKALLLNACLPPISGSSTAAVILIHGGGFELGNKDSGGMTETCRDLAANGMAAFVIDYRLAPDFTYPAQIDDVSAAVKWLRYSDQATRFGIDPERIGLFGTSAGAIMAASVGTAGTGSQSTGVRVAAVVALSPAADLTESGVSLGTPGPDEVKLILQYLGCRDVTNCPDAKAASPLYDVDPSDPPFYIVAAQDEIVPVQQSEALRDALDKAQVPVTLEVKPGSKHGYELLDDSTRSSILSFLKKNLGGPE